MQKQDWAQHTLIRSLCEPKRDKINRKILARLKAEYFSDPSCGEAYRRLEAVYIKTNRLLSWKELLSDPTLSEETKRKLRAKELKRKANLRRDDSLECPTTFDQYTSLVDVVVAKARLVNFIELHNSLSDKLNLNLTSTEVDSLINEATSSLDRISSLQDVAHRTFELTPETSHAQFKQFYKELQNQLFIPTGYRAYDEPNVGIPKDSLWLIAGKTGCGKSSFVLNTVMNMYDQFGVRACIIPYEMSIEQMQLRVAANLIGVPANQIIKDFKELYPRIKSAMKRFLTRDDDDPACLHFHEPASDETPLQTMKILAPMNYDIVVFDSINLAPPEGGKEGWEALDIAGRKCKLLASKIKTCICFIAQLDVKEENVRYSRALMEHASNAWIWRETSSEIREGGFITVEQPKGRGQDTRPFRLRADLSISRFTDFISEEGSYEDAYRIDKPKRRRKKLSEGFDSDVPSDKDV